MNPSRVKMVAEHDGHYEMHDGRSSFRVPKNGLSEAMHGKIRALSAKEEGDARAYQEGVDAAKAPQGLPGGMSESDWNRARGKQYGEQVDEANQARWGAQNMADGGDVLESRPSDVASFQPPPVPVKSNLVGYFKDGSPIYADPAATDFRPVAPVAQPPSTGAGGGTGGGGGNDTIFSASRDGMIPDRGEGGQSGGVGRAQEPDRTPSRIADRKDLPASLKLKSDAPAQTEETAPQTVAPVAAPAKRGGGYGMAVPKPDDYGPVTAAGEAAAKAKYEAESDAMRQQAALESARIKQMEVDAGQQKEASARAAAESRAMMGKVQEASDEMSRIDTSVDPGRFWATRSTGQKIAGILGIALSGIGGGQDGINRAVGMLNQAIDRDIDAQKSEHEMRLKKGQASVNSAQSMYGLHHQTLQDDLAARSAAKASGDEMAAAKAKQLAMSTQDPIMKANFLQVHAELTKDAAMNKEKVQERMFDRGIKSATLGIQQQGLEIDRMKAAAGGAGGVKAIDQKTMDEIQQVEQLHRLIQSNGAKLKKLVDQYGTAELTGPQEGQMNQLLDDIAVAKSKLNDPMSAARPGEVELERKNLFNPGYLQSSDSVKAKIDSYLDNAKKRRDLKYEVLRLPNPDAQR